MTHDKAPIMTKQKTLSNNYSSDMNMRKIYRKTIHIISPINGGVYLAKGGTADFLILNCLSGYFHEK